MLRAGFGIFSDILPGSIADVVGVNPPYVRLFRAGCSGLSAGTAIAPGVPDSAVDATVAANQTFTAGFAQGQLSCASPQRIQRPVCLRLPSRRCQMENFTRPISWNGAWASSTNSERTASVHAQYVGTRAVNQPYLTQVNGYQTVCDGCFAPFPYAAVHRPAIRSRDAVFHRRQQPLPRLAIDGDEAHRARFQGQVNYTWSRCMDTVSNGGFLQFSAGGILSPLPGDLARDYGPCDYDIRHNLNAQYVYQLPFKMRNRALGYALNGWQISGTVFWHSGIPFSVLSTPYSANGDGIVNGSGPQFASVVPGVPLYDAQSRFPASRSPARSNG